MSILEIILHYRNYNAMTEPVFNSCRQVFMSTLQQSFPSAPLREKREIFTETDPATGTVTCEAWCKDGKLDRADGPAVVYRDAATGTVTHEEWCKDGKLDRADGPAFILRDAATGTVTHEEWCKYGKLDRADGPAFIRRDAATGTVTYEAWCKDGKQIAAPSPAARPAPAPG